MPRLFNIGRAKVNEEYCFKEEIQAKIDSVVSGRLKYVLCDDESGSLVIYYREKAQDVYAVKIKNVDSGIYYSVSVIRALTAKELESFIMSHKNMFYMEPKFLKAMIGEMIKTLRAKGIALA